MQYLVVKFRNKVFSVRNKSLQKNCFCRLTSPRCSRTDLFRLTTKPSIYRKHTSCYTKALKSFQTHNKWSTCQLKLIPKHMKYLKYHETKLRNEGIEIELKYRAIHSKNVSIRFLLGFGFHRRYVFANHCLRVLTNQDLVEWRVAFKWPFSFYSFMLSFGNKAGEIASRTLICNYFSPISAIPITVPSVCV